MKFNWFNKKTPEAPSEEELDSSQAVILSFDLTSELGEEDEQKQVYELEDQLDEALQAADAGDCDGHEFGDKEAVLYLYGPDADMVFKLAEPILQKFPLKPIRVTLRYGEADDPDAKEVQKRLV
jgi:hypothetical protein